MCSFDRFRQRFGDVFFVFFKCLGARLNGLPFELQPGGFQNAHDRLGNLSANSIARNECDLVGHEKSSSQGSAPVPTWASLYSSFVAPGLLWSSISLSAQS